MDSRINSGKVFPIQGNGFQLVGHSWMPTTPEKCITTRSDPAVADMQGSQSNRMDLPGWDAVHSGFIQMWNSNEAVYNNEMGRSGTNFMEDASLPYRYDLMTTGVNRVAQPASANTMVGRNMSMDGRALTPNLHPQVSTQRDSMVGRIHSSISRPPHINCSSPQATQYGFQAPYTTCIDLNLPLTEADVTFNATTSSQFIPATPNQGKTLEGTPSVIVNLPEKCRNEEKGKLKNIFLPRERKANHSNIELLHTVLDSSLAVNPTALVKPTDLDRGSDQVIDLNQTPQHKPPKPRKHRPKVIVEGKPKRAPKPSTSMSTNSKENPTGKRKYMLKSLQESRTRRTDSAEKFANPSTGKRKYTLKKRLEEHPIQCENLKWGTTYPRTQTGKRRCVRKKILGESPIIYEDSVGMTPNFNAGKKFGHQVAPIQHADANRDTAYCVPGTSVKSCRRMLHIESENTGGMHNLKESLNSSFGFESLKLVGAENLGKRKSISQGNQQNSSLLENQQSVVLSNLRNFPKHVPSDHTPISDVQITAAQLDLLHTTRMNLNGIENKTTETGEQVQREVPQTLFPAKSDCKSHERTKQIEYQIDPRLEGNMSSFSFESRELLTELYSSEYRSLCSENPGGASLLCQEKIQVEGYRRNSKISISYEAPGKLQARGSSTLSISIQPEKVKMPQPQKGVLEDHRQSSAKRGRPSQQKHNQIEGVSYKPMGASINNQKNALVSYKKDGTVVPYVVSVKRKSKPKVNLDPETERVWKLLMGKEGSEGLEGSDKVKEQWWQNEREGLRLRVESFIERMHLIQGNRRFSKWKGSVVDSVIGVFLTQNVSDHLSSSAFMVLASKFPLKSRKNRACDRGKRSVVVEEPDDCTLDLNDTIKNCEEITFSVCNGSSTTNPTSTIMFEGEVHCTGEEVISLQDSVITQTSERVISYSGSNSETGDLASGHRHNRVDNLSYMELLTSTDAELNKIHNLSYMELLTTTDPLDEYCSISESLLFEEGSGDGHEEADMKSALQGSSFQNFINMDCPYVSNISRLRDSVSPSIAYMLQPTIQHIVQEAEVLRIPGEASTSSWSSTVCAVTKEIHANCTCKSDGHEIPILHFCQPSACQGSNSISYHSQSHEWNNDMQLYSTPTGEPHNHAEAAVTGQNIHRPPIPKTAERFKSFEELTHFINNSVALNSEEQVHFTGVKNIQASANTLKTRRGKVEGEKKDAIDWDSLRKQVPESRRKARNEDTIDSLDYEALRSASVKEIADAIKERGMNKMLAERIKEFLDRVVNDHGSIDLEWLRDVPPDKAKEYLLSMRGLGLKSVECVRLLTLHHLAFPVDTNVGRVAVRLGWVPLQPLPESVQLHLLTLYPILETVQKYLWPRLCKLDQQTLYELHYQMITFGKVFCTKERPNCNACPMRAECKHFASAFASARLALPGPEEKSVTTSMAPSFAKRKPDIVIKDSLPLPPPEEKSFEARTYISSCVPIIEEPSTPDHDEVIECYDIEDSLLDDLEDIPTIEFSAETFKRNVEDCVQGPIDLKAAEMSSALVVVHQDAASIRHPKLKFVSRLRTEHLVYELPDSHPLLKGMESREPDDPSPYLLAIWAPGETANSTRSSEPCQSQERGKLCHSKTCFSCNGIREADSQIVRGTILIPCRTAMRGSFPLNGTYFQVNEVFADHESSYNPIDVPRNWIWNLRRRMAYFGTSVSTIVRGLSTEAIQYCFWKGFVCVRGFDQEQRVPKPLAWRLHRSTSKVATDQES